MKNGDLRIFLVSVNRVDGISKRPAITLYTNIEDKAISTGLYNKPYLLFSIKDVWNQKKKGQLS